MQGVLEQIQIQVKVQTFCYDTGGAIDNERYGRAIADLTPEEATAAGFSPTLPRIVDISNRRAYRLQRWGHSGGRRDWSNNGNGYGADPGSYS